MALPISQQDRVAQSCSTALCSNINDFRFFAKNIIHSEDFTIKIFDLIKIMCMHVCSDKLTRANNGYYFFNNGNFPIYGIYVFLRITCILITECLMRQMAVYIILALIIRTTKNNY